MLSKIAKALPRGSPSSSRLQRATVVAANRFQTRQLSSGGGLERSQTTPPDRVGGLIIGGGVTGCSLLYNLAKLGVDVACFEKAELASGATWHAAGLVTNFHGGNNFRFWHQEGIDTFTHWQKELGHDLSFHSPGSIRLIPNDPGYIDEAKHQLAKAKLYEDLFGGPPIRMVSPDEIQELHPLCDVASGNTDIWGGLMTFGDGHIDPTSVTNRFAAEALSHGGKIHRFMEVVGCKIRPDKKWEVVVKDRSDKGNGGEHVVIADFVINAGGLWCDAAGAMSGVHIPAVVLQHQYVITESIPEVKEYHKKHGQQLPVLRDLKGSFYLRDEREGFLIGPYEGAASVILSPEDWRKDGMPADYSNFLFDGDTDRLMPHLERAMELVPKVGESGLQTVLNGPTCWPADGNHLVGPCGEWDKAPNYWLACAESYGIAHSAGLGRYLAEWIVNGEPPYELTEADPTRYGPWATKEWVGEKVKETYGFNNHVHYPNDNYQAARPVLPLKNEGIYRLLESKGCQFGFHNGWEGPNFFIPEKAGEQVGNIFASWRRPTCESYVQSECIKMFEFGGICYWPFAKYRVTGPGAEKFLDGLVANRIPKPGRCNLGHFLTPKGKVYSEVTMARLANGDFYVVSYPEMEMHDWRWMHMHAPADGSVTIENITDKFGTLMVNGPKSLDVMEKLVPDFAWKSLKIYDNKEVELIPGVTAHVLKVSFTGEEGVELHIPLADVPRVYEALMAVEPNLCDWGGIAMGSFRLEKGIKAAGSDFTKDHNAFEAGLERFCQIDKKDFVGADALRKLRDEGGSKQTSMYMEVHTPEGIDCVGNEPLLERSSGKTVGFTTSGGWGYMTQKSIAFGYVDRAFLDKRLAVSLLGETYDVTVHSEPLMDMAGVRARKEREVAAAASAASAASTSATVRAA